MAIRLPTVAVVGFVVFSCAAVAAAAGPLVPQTGRTMKAVDPELAALQARLDAAEAKIAALEARDAKQEQAIASAISVNAQQAGAISSLQTSMGNHTHGYNRPQLEWKTVTLDGKSASLIHKWTTVPATTTPPAP